MSVVITVYDDLARRLQVEAENRRVSVEKLAVDILDNAVRPRDGERAWGNRNRRRLELIRKSTRCELSQQEQTELDQLQSWLDEQFEPFDTGLLKQLDEMKQAVARLSAEHSHD